MNNVVSLRLRADNDTGCPEGIRRFVESHKPEPMPDDRDAALTRQALLIRGWAETATKAFGIEATIRLMEFALERAKAKRDSS